MGNRRQDRTRLALHPPCRRHRGGTHGNAGADRRRRRHHRRAGAFARRCGGLARRLGEPPSDQPQPGTGFSARDDRTDHSSSSRLVPLHRFADRAGLGHQRRGPPAADIGRLDTYARNRANNGAARRGAPGHLRGLPLHDYRALSSKLGAPASAGAPVGQTAATLPGRERSR